MVELRIMIVDDHLLYTEALSSILSNQPKNNFIIKKVLNDGAKVIEELSKNFVDVILLDLNLPKVDGLELIPIIKKKFKHLKILVVTMYDNPKFIQDSLRAGAHGYVLKSNGLADLIKGIHEVMADNTFVAEGLMVFPKGEHINGSGNGKFQEDSFTIKSKLTRRELEILKLISEAKSNKDIAEDLFISDQTVSVHRKNIMRKLNVSNTASLIKFAMDNNLI